MDIELIKCFANDNGWELVDPQPDKWYLRFIKGSVIFDLWFTTGTIRIIKDNKPTYFKDNDIKMVEERFKVNS